MLLSVSNNVIYSTYCIGWIEQKPLNSRYRRARRLADVNAYPDVDVVNDSRTMQGYIISRQAHCSTARTAYEDVICILNDSECGHWHIEVGVERRRSYSELQT